VKPFEYRHVVGLEETNVVGNVYFVNHVRWQGRCRELFLREHAPSVLDEFARGLSLVTTSCSVDYVDELRALDEVLVQMWLEALSVGRLAMRFEYYRLGEAGRSLVARGRQEVACLRRGPQGASPEPLPRALVQALESFRGD